MNNDIEEIVVDKLKQIINDQEQRKGEKIKAIIAQACYFFDYIYIYTDNMYENVKNTTVGTITAFLTKSYKQ